MQVGQRFVLAEVSALTHETGERFYEAEQYRLKGELTLQSESLSTDSKAGARLQVLLGGAVYDCGDRSHTRNSQGAVAHTGERAMNASTAILCLGRVNH